MTRPKFPTGIVLPYAVIAAINEKQAAYDKDPKGYERREREKAERRREELEEEQRMRDDEFEAAQNLAYYD